MSRAVIPQNRPVPETTVVIIMGTLVPQFISFIYQPLMDVFIRRGYKVVILAIPDLGLKPLGAAAKVLAPQAFSNGPDHRYILIGHSQGGLHALDLATLLPEQILKIINLGTPHHGTLLANLGHWVSWIPAIRDMEAHSQHLHDLREMHQLSEDLIVSVFTIFDELVFPWFAPRVTWGQNVVLVPKVFHRALKRAGWRRSEQVELIHAYAEHLLLIWNKRLHACIEGVLDELEAAAFA